MENLTQHNNSTDISKLFYHKKIPLLTEYYAELGHLVTSRTTGDLLSTTFAVEE
jgi:hypothetical protein